MHDHLAHRALGQFAFLDQPVEERPEAAGVGVSVGGGVFDALLLQGDKEGPDVLSADGQREL